ncbi:MAG: hypothetical protein RMJ89_05045 [Flammeovirgaceae bacterium]|nr:hypothetical protein [Flammeovirgaceae bacterium]
MESIAEVSHIAFSDESYYTNDRYRSVAVVTFESGNRERFTNAFHQLLGSSQVSEFKWSKLRQARERFAAIKLIDEVILLAQKNLIRLDVLIWDTQDSRHQVEGRDDIANLQRMYYHLFKNVLKTRWSAQSTWFLFPDENSALDWQSVQDFLDTAGLSFQISSGLFDNKPFSFRLSRDFEIVGIKEISSEKEPLCQVADLFAGIGAYSHSAFAKYLEWEERQNGQMRLFTEEAVENQKFTNSENERFIIIKHLDDSCKKNKFRVSLKSGKGFKTFNPRFPINFWMYEPQNSKDKAPIKNGG